jgi:hypothetical protein
MRMRTPEHLRRYGLVDALGRARAMIERVKWTTPVKEKTLILEE